MKSIFQIFIYSIFLILVISTKNIFSDEMSGGHENAKMFIEEKRYIEAEKLAISLLTNNPSDVTAEYILTSAWVGLGREEAKKGNLDKAIELLQKARQKWPFDQDLKKEIELLGNISFKKNVSSNSSQNHDKNYAIFILVKETYDSIQELKLEIHALANNKESDYYRQELVSSSKREVIYVIIISVMTLVSLLNIFAFYFFIQKKKQ
ncbi:tetratricopeptide repeat protein (plasmid) [Leptospira interrogans serovar Canicola]|uniref:Tetratricopeptide repeat protein n=1 Tax=Leptospira interrogans serovar Canicola TaxID=211880 RepID=A0AAP9WG56_LEPIR|nr:tetratricopeptide repeat protein [Leptospira interrogans]QOI45063.1 tetratricopeptide repeat protein [Leptospira interrogans serovar Canicola]